MRAKHKKKKRNKKKTTKRQRQKELYENIEKPRDYDATPIRTTHDPLYVWVKKENKKWVHDEAARRGLSASKFIDFWIDDQICKEEKKGAG